MKELSNEALAKMDKESREQYLSLRDRSKTQDQATALKLLTVDVRELQKARKVAKEEVYPDFRRRLDALEKPKTAPKTPFKWPWQK